MGRSEDPAELEAWARAELGTLKRLSAPAGLSARVWARLRAESQRPWWRRSWWSWPRSLRVAIGLPLALLAVAFAMAPWLLEPYLPGSSLVLAPLWDRVLGLGSVLSAASRALVLLGQTGAESPWLWGAAASIGISYLGLVGLGTLLVRFARKRARGGGPG